MGKKYVTSLLLEEDQVKKLMKIANDLGYQTLSGLLRDIINEIITTHELLLLRKQVD